LSISAVLKTTLIFRKNAIKRVKAELAQSFASVSILSKNAIKRVKAELAQSLASVSILFKIRSSK